MIEKIASSFRITNSKRVKYGWIIGLSFYFSYWSTNTIAVKMNPHYLPMTWLDNLIPFWPYTQWIYHLEIPFLIYSYSQFKTDLARTRFAMCLIVLIVFCSLFFLLYPTTFPRELFPVPDNSWNSKALEFFRKNLDEPTNCFPSLHVGTCYMVSYVSMSESKIKSIITFFIATLIALSTFTTKQHYIADAISGFLVTTVIWYGFGKRIKFNT